MKKCFQFLLLVLVLSYTSSFAADSDAIGQVKTFSGSAHIVRGTEKIAAKQGMKIVKSDTLLTGKQSFIGIIFSDNSTISLGSDTKLQLSQYEFNVLEKKVGFVGKIRRGSIVYLSGLITKMNPDATRFETPAAVAGVKGTKLAILVEGNDNE